jgi:protein-tyrosine phosphatase
MRYFLILVFLLIVVLSFSQINLGLDKSPNFRTYNGLKNKEGKSFKDNMLFRSGTIASLTETDKRKLIDLKLTTIIDFRTDYELQREPDDTIGLNVQSVRIPLGNINQESSLTMFKVLNNPSATESTVDSLMVGFYVKFADMIKSYQLFFNELLKPDSRVLFHCSAGKDRTGIASALLLFAMDFDESVIIQDFLRSNEAAKSTDLNKLKMYGIPEKLGATMMGVKADYLKIAFDQIKSKYGSIDSLLTTELGLGTQQKQILKEKYLN